MKKLALAVVVAAAAAFTSVTPSSAAPASAMPMTLPFSVAPDAIQQDVLPVHYRSYYHRHSHRRRSPSIYIGPGGVYVNPGYRRPRSCRRVRRICRNEWGGGRSYRRCVRNRGCRP